MKLITNEQHRKLLANYQRSTDLHDGTFDPKPVVKFFTPDAGCTWLITERYDDGDTLFGLCDLGVGYPELGTVSLTELQTVRGRFGLPVERDRHFTATKSLSAYAEEAYRLGHINA